MTEAGVAVVFDVNVLLQGLGNPNGASGLCLRYALTGRVTLVISNYVLKELRRVSGYPRVARRFPRLASRVSLLIESLAESGLIRADLLELLDGA